MTQVHVIYHADCQDGFGAVWAVHRRLEQEQGLRVVYHPAAYGDPPRKRIRTARSTSSTSPTPPASCSSSTPGTGAG